TGVQTCALPISGRDHGGPKARWFEPGVSQCDAAAVSSRRKCTSESSGAVSLARYRKSFSLPPARRGEQDPPPRVSREPWLLASYGNETWRRYQGSMVTLTTRSEP